MKTPMRARLKKCAACGKAKPLTEYAHHGHKMCSACIGFTNSRAGDVLDMLRRKADAPVRNTNPARVSFRLIDLLGCCARRIR